VHGCDGEPIGVARKGDTFRKGERVKRTARARRRVPFLVPVVIVGVMAFLYYRPLASYAETHRQLSNRRSEVVELRTANLRLQKRLQISESTSALGREARRIGYVRPGERLFIVKGILEWRQLHATAGEK